ncbi:MAG: DNA cytosine methyltransferase [Dehalococcoidales bacterium]|nr:DNA cytosine methyltransferase [Dehalococcoidales bacterium]
MDFETDLRHMVERGIGPGTFRSREVDPWSDYVETASGLLVPGHAVEEKPKDILPTGVDIFCGCGGFSLGFIQAGFNVLAGLDNAVDCIHTYLANLGGPDTEVVFISPEDKERWTDHIKRSLNAKKKLLKGEKDPKAREHFGREVDDLEHGRWGSWHHHFDPKKPPVKAVFLGDVRKVTGQFILDHIGMKIEELSCVFGSPPCQGFSRANSKKTCMDPRNSLVFDWVRLVVEMRPATLCMENVPAIVEMTTPEGVLVIDAMCRILEDGGFGTYNGLKKALLETSGAGMAMRGKKVEKQSKNKEKADVKQAALF